MKQKLIPATIMLVIMAIISLPTQSNEYTGKAISQTSILTSGKQATSTAEDCSETTFTNSPALLLLTL